MSFEDVKVGQKVRYRGSIKCVIGHVGTCMYKAPDVDVHIARLEDALKGLFTLGVSETEMHDLFNDACKQLFLEKRYRDRIAKIKDKVRKCQN